MLYRKYRPQKFTDIAGQEHIVRTLEGAIRSDSVGHAYLFCGPRGTGKTTMARLLAKALNCEKRQKGQTEPCNICGSCTAIMNGASLDLIEIDAASNRGIDEIRNIKDSAHVAASSSNYKIFIIDEVHMLTTTAFNALLKVLEEPPEHVTFILATTEAHKVLDTILSRVQRFDFKKLRDEEIIKKLEMVVKKEGITIDQPALAMLSAYASGSLRDAESALAKLIAYSPSSITQKDAAENLGIVPETTHSELLKHITNNEQKEAINIIGSVYNSGVSVENFSKQFIQYVRGNLVSQVQQNQVASSQKLIAVINAFITARNKIKDSPIPTLPLELAVIDLTSSTT